MAKIVTVYIDTPRSEDRKGRDLKLLDMSYIRWHKISEALRRLGHTVDMAVPDAVSSWPTDVARDHDVSCPRVPLSRVDWERYDVVKTLFHLGFETLENHGGARHPFIISKLGSVVGPREIEGVYFHGTVRQRLFETQKRISEAARYITLLSLAAEQLWISCCGRRDSILRVPGGVDRDLPAPGADPYPQKWRRRCIFSGNIYDRTSQPTANGVIVAKLNTLGRLLAPSGMRLCVLGTGDTRQLDPRYVSHLGHVPYEKSWDYLHCADVGVVVAAGNRAHGNESSKIYHYLRAGLPFVTEAGFPNEHVVHASGLGVIVGAGELAEMASCIVEAAHTSWNREAGVRYVLEYHTWDARAGVYDKILRDRGMNDARTWRRRAADVDRKAIGRSTQGAAEDE